MPYVTAAEVRLILSRNQGDTAGNAASLSDATMAEQIEEAESRVNAKLATQYKVPFADPVPAVIQNITRDIAAFLADLTYREIRDYESELNPVYLRYKEAMKQLDELAAGKTVIPGQPPDDGTDAASGEIVGTYGGELMFDGNEFNQRPGYDDRPILWGHFG